ncbi:branched-chain amino acid ABC transporter substrate-binding protein [Curvibacter sp. HBC61]|uniref:Branched-chain amino acid ABC transporter substrate-binding protein n=1 Tax=Curvibacter cyanobacteriorum TaxID=3026422 RepID=A0ABT5MZH3_9BURK|nr:branched-chain amino acid ABC transporter substrate-binding protein [Curvibacter sp. HBC61]MDD0839444.1 branched-chain amino acid ABC transporter substrate-binding protein [Curvibacter sp. HBC61]
MLSSTLFLRHAVSVAVGVLGAAGLAQAQEVQTVKIGHAGPTSGGIAHIGKDTENGVRLAVEEANAQNLVIGGKKIRFELAAEDDAGDPRQATAVAQKMCDAQVAGLVGHLQSGTSIPASGLYAKCELPNITASASNPDLTKPGYKTTFRLIANDNALGAALAYYAADALKVKRVAIIDDRTAYGQGVAAVFKATALQKGLTVVGEEFTNDKATDFTSILTAIKSKKPEAIFYGGLDAQAGPMLRQLEQLGMADVKLFGGDALCTEKLAELSAKAAPLSGVTCATGGASLAKMPGGADWKKKYDARFPGQFQIYSPYAYDAARVLIEAMKSANSVDPKVYLAALAKTNFKGVTGAIAFTPKGELTQPAVTLYGYRDGVRTPLN